MRLFAALPLPSPAVEHLSRLRLRLSAPNDGLRWSPPQQWHITLQFYGEVDDACAVSLERVLAKNFAGASSAEVSMGSLGCFAGKGILFAAVDHTPELMDLRDRVVAAAQACGLQPESRPFHPHVTMARSKGRSGHKSLHRISTPELPPFGPALRWSASAILLLRSTLSPHGAEYSTLGTVFLRDATAVT